MLSTRLNDAKIADLLVMGADVRTNANDGKTALYSSTFRRWQSGRVQGPLARGAFMVLGAHSQSSNLICGEQQIKLVAMPSKENDHPRLTRFEMDPTDMVSYDASRFLNNCVIANRAGVINQIPANIGVALVIDDVQPIEHLSFETNEIDKPRNSHLSTKDDLELTVELSASASPQTHTLDLGDLDGDGMLDLILTGGESGFDYHIDETVTAWQFKQGQWQKQPAYGLHFITEPKPIILYADDDQDGDLDIIYQMDSIVYRVNNNGDGFAPLRTTLFEAADFELQQVVDLNGDGKLDFIGINETSVKTFITTDDGVVTGHTIEQPDQHILALVDFNDDKRLDLLLQQGQIGGGGSLSLWLHQDIGYQFVSNHMADIFGYRLHEEVRTIDVNGDGHLDIVFSVKRATSFIYNLAVRYNNGDGRFAPATLLMSDSKEQITAIEEGDFNGDGSQDMVLIASDFGLSRNLQLFLRGQDKALVYTSSHSLNGVDDDGFFSKYTIKGVGDFDNDGRDDLVVRTSFGLFGFRGETYGVLLSGSDDMFSVSQKLSSSSLSDEQRGYFNSSVKIFDYDDDGDKDVVITTLGYTTVFENTH